MKYLLSFLALFLFSTSAKAQYHPQPNVVLIFDESGSMAEPLADGRRKIDAAKIAVPQVLNSLPDDANVGILNLTHGWLVPLGPINRQLITDRVNALQPDGGTPLGAALKIAADKLLELRSKQHYGEYSIVVMTDGEATDDPTSAENIGDILRRGIKFDVVGVQMDKRHDLADLAHSYCNVTDSANLSSALKAAFAETTNIKDSTGLSDFDVIAPLPDDLAKSAMQSLGSFISQNQPINQPPPAPQAATTGGSIAPPVDVPPMNVQSPVAAAPASNDTSYCVFLVIGILVVVELVVLVIIKANCGNNY